MSAFLEWALIIGACIGLGLAVYEGPGDPPDPHPMHTVSQPSCGIPFGSTFDACPDNNQRDT